MVKMKNTILITDLNNESLLELSHSMGLSLNMEEMIRLRNYFRYLGREPISIRILTIECDAISELKLSGW